MKGNEVLLTLKNKGFEQGVTSVLLRLAEEQEDIHRSMMEFAKTLETAFRVQTMMNGVLDGMKSQLDKFNIPDDGMGATREGLK